MKIAALLERLFRKSPENELKILTGVIGSSFKIINDLNFYTDSGNFSNLCDEILCEAEQSAKGINRQFCTCKHLFSG